MSRRIALLFLLFVAVSGGSTACSENRSIVVASTTSTQDSGLFDYLLPRFKQRTGIEVKVVAQGTGQALETGRRGDADVVFVHARAQEEAFVSEGAGVRRYPVMYNDFVLIGPATDPAASRGKDIASALLAIRKSGSAFISRGDNSGTHIAEINLWKRAGIEIEQEHGAWYRAIGQGMGAALNTAAAASAYVVADRGTWISFKNKRDLAVLVEGDASLLNEYGVILVNPRTHPQVKASDGQAFIDWLISAEGQAAIAAFRIEGQQLFFPNARQAP